MNFIIKHKKRMSILIILTMVLWFIILKTNFTINLIYMISTLEEKFGEFYIKTLDFKLADYKEQIKSGVQEKYVLKGHDGSKWVFKVFHSNDDKNKCLFANRLASILGIDVPKIYNFIILINGQEKKGLIQEFVLSTNSNSCLRIGDFKNDLQNKFIPKVLINIYFNWLFYRDTNRVEMLISPTNTLYLIDLCDVLKNDPASINTGGLKINNFLDFKQVYFFLSNLQAISDYWMTKYLERTLKLSLDAKELNRTEKLIFIRKRLLTNEFLKGYYSDLRFYNIKYNLYDNLFYRINIAVKISMDILKISFRVLNSLFLCERREVENKFALVASGDAWAFLMSHFDTFKVGNLNNLFLEARNKLIVMRYQCKDLREKLAITLYLRQVRTLQAYIEKYKLKEDNRIKFLYADRVLISIAQDMDSFKSASEIDSWTNFLDYQKNGEMEVRIVNGEDEYISGLLELIKGRNHHGIDLLKVSQKKGYAIEEIASIINSLI